MARSTWKGLFFSKSIYTSLFRFNLFKHKKWIVYSRNSSIPNKFINSICGIDKGMSFKYLYIRKLIVGHKFGEFAFTRKNYHFTPKETKSKLRR